MVVTYTFAGLPVTDYRAAYEWYVCLLGRQADMYPRDGEAVWRLTTNSALYVVEDPPRAGRALLTLAVDDLAEHDTRMRRAGLSIAELADGGTPRRLVVTDLDGNKLTFFQVPEQPNVSLGRQGLWESQPTRL